MDPGGQVRCTYQLDSVANSAHDNETNANGANHLEVLLLVRLGTSVDKVSTLLDEFHGDFSDLFQSVLSHLVVK